MSHVLATETKLIMDRIGLLFGASHWCRIDANVKARKEEGQHPSRILAYVLREFATICDAYPRAFDEPDYRWAVYDLASHEYVSRHITHLAAVTAARAYSAKHNPCSVHEVGNAKIK